MMDLLCGVPKDPHLSWNRNGNYTKPAKSDNSSEKLRRSATLPNMEKSGSASSSLPFHRHLLTKSERLFPSQSSYNTPLMGLLKGEDCVRGDSRFSLKRSSTLPPTYIKRSPSVRAEKATPGFFNTLPTTVSAFSVRDSLKKPFVAPHRQRKVTWVDIRPVIYENIEETETSALNRTYTSPHKGLCRKCPTDKDFLNVINPVRYSTPKKPLYEFIPPPADFSFPEEESLGSDLSRRDSLASESTNTTATDEGVYSETCSTEWSSAYASSSSIQPMSSSTEEGCTLYSSLSSDLYEHLGARPKDLKCIPSLDSLSSELDTSDGTDTISSYDFQLGSLSDMPFRRTKSLRNPSHLPVTPTLLKLLQLGLEHLGTDGSTNNVVDQDLGVGDVGEVSNTVKRRERLHPPRTDAHRFSQANLEDSGDVELDAILGELCALETQFDFELSSRASSSSIRPSLNQLDTGQVTKVPQASVLVPQQQQTPCNPPLVMKPKFDLVNVDDVTAPSLTRTDSPDNDSAFSDNVSMLSSESSASSGASGSRPNRRTDSKGVLQTDHAAQLKAEKIKMALEKIKEANVKKLFVKVFTTDGSTKSLLVDEKMTVSHVTRILVDKNHVRMDPKWAIVEHIPDLYMERFYEDDEMLVENLLLWARDSKNKLYFVERTDRYDMFLRPEKYLLIGPSSQKNAELDDEARSTLIEEFFSSTGVGVPEVEGPLFLKSEGKKAWKKFYFVLRTSGLYYCPKGKSSRSSKDLVCLITLEVNQVYQGIGWKKKYKSPTDWCFAIKHPHLQAKSSKYIRYLCAEDPSIMAQWIMGMRIAKCGQRMLENYRAIIDDLVQEDIDMLASSRSFSVDSMAGSGGSKGASLATTPSSESRSLDSCLAPSLTDDEALDAQSISAESSSQDTPVNTLTRTSSTWSQNRDTPSPLMTSSSSSSSGCLSERSSSAGTPTGEQGFEADFPPHGTIKRKPPASTPKLPLTNTTRLLVKDDGSIPDNKMSVLRSSLRRSVTDEGGSLRRRVSRSKTPALVKDEDPESLPLPPPPLEVNGCDVDHLPPPPPELLASTLSLNSLPPPPDDVTIPGLPQEDLMTLSLMSLPPPPSPLRENAAPQPLPSYRSPSPPAVAPKPRRESLENSPLPLVNGVKKDQRWSPDSTALPPLPPSPYHSQKSPQRKVKRITFVDEVDSKPPLPKRSDSTRLSASPGKLSAPGCKVTPPRAFLSNLQKVMQKKWQVAQKCKDFDKMPHEVLGFRDPIPPSESERNVGAWIQEHYGNSVYENISPIHRNSDCCQTMRPHNSIILEQPQRRHSHTVPARRKPPPPPPKRADTTQLSSRQ